MVSECEAFSLAESGLRVLVIEMDGIEDWSVSERLSWCRLIGTMIGTVTVTLPSPFLFT